MPVVDRPYQLGIAAGFAAAAILGLLVLSTRFDVSTPSMVDDWNPAGDAPRGIGDLLELFVHPIGARFRPSWELWNEVEWHTLGAPQELTGPNLWGVLRMLLFVAGAVLVPSVIAASSEPRPSPLGLAALGAATGILLFSGPWTNVDFFRLGPQEPVMFGAASCGAALLLFGTRRVIERRQGGRSAASTLALLAVFAGGFTLWLLGIYHKEASICVLVLAPFLYLFLDRRWRERGIIEHPLWRLRAFQLTAVAMLLPVLHLALVSSTISDKGASIYGADRPTGVGGWFERALDSLSLQWNEMSVVVGTPAWRLTAVLVIALLAAIAVIRRRVPWLPLGLVITGWAALVFQGVALIEQPRYYIAPMALFAGSALLLLAQAPKLLRWLALGGAVILAWTNLGAVRDTLNAWEAMERDEATALHLVAELHPESCPVYMRNLDLERSEALPNLLPLIGEELSGPCRHGFPAILVGRKTPVPGLPPGATESMRHVCADESTLAKTTLWEITGCRRLRAVVSGQAVKDVLAKNRVKPGVEPRELRRSLTP